MDIYLVQSWGEHHGCIDDWSDMHDQDIEAIFDSLEEAIKYARRLYSYYALDSMHFYDAEGADIIKFIMNSDSEKIPVYSFNFTEGREEFDV